VDHAVPQHDHRRQGWRWHGGRTTISRPAENGSARPMTPTLDARPSAGSGWEGYTVHLSETCDEARACHDNCVSHGWTKIGRRDRHSVGRGTICESGDQHRRS
jgi:hypothetical protein